MSEDRIKEPGQGVAVRVADRDEVLELNFVPQWARKGASEGGDLGRYDDRGGGMPRDDRRRDRGRPSGGRPSGGRDAGGRGDRRPRRLGHFID